MNRVEVRKLSVDLVSDITINILQHGSPSDRLEMARDFAFLIYDDSAAREKELLKEIEELKEYKWMYEGLDK